MESPIGLWVAVEGFAAPDGQTIAFEHEAAEAAMIGPEITADFPQVLAALVSLASS